MAYRHLLNFSVQTVESEQQALVDLLNELPSQVSALFVNSQMMQITYSEKVSEQNVESINQRQTFQALVDLLKFQAAQPVILKSSEISAISPFFEQGVVWSLPIPTRTGVTRWLLLLAPEHMLDAQQVEMLFLKLGWTLTSLHLHLHDKELQKANAWIERELDEMTRIQQLMLPDRDTKIPGTKVAFAYRALKGAGGDYLDFVSLEEDKSSTEPHTMGMIVADVTGHGPSAAVEAAMLDAILRTFKPTEELAGPGQVFEYINQHFFTRKERGSFLTASIIRYLPKERVVTYANAGHPHAYLKRGEQLIPLDEGGIPIGVLRDNAWQSYKVDVQKGDTIFVYTDVVIETQNPEQEDFGFERLEQALKSGPNDPDGLISHIEQQLIIFCHCKQFEDDLTMCAVQFTE